jgi:SPP1 gp7 family putative phage head morphogenesis protein
LFVKNIMPDFTKIFDAMDAIATVASKGMTDDTDRTLSRVLAIAEPLIEAKDVKAIQDLNVGLHLAFQRSLFLLAESAWLTGATHGLEELKADVPDELQTLTLSPLTDKIKALVFGLFRIVPKTFRNTPAEKAVKRRVIKLAGNFSKDTLERVRGHLLASVVPSATQGVIDRAELVRRIQGELGVARRRAETIAVTETTFLYNQGRLASFKESRLVTFFLFSAIGGKEGDGRTTEICKSRAGLVIEATDKATLSICTPACHVRCRSVLRALMPSVNPEHQKLVDAPARRIGSRKLVPLMKGWRSG